MINSNIFFEELKRQLEVVKDNYDRNRLFNGGQYKYYKIIQCNINGVRYYTCEDFKKAYNNKATLKRVITRYIEGAWY